MRNRWRDLRRAAAVGLLVMAAALAAPAPQAVARTSEAPGHAHGDGSGHVVALRQDPDGTVTVDLYEPREGVTPVQLYKKLKAAGVPDLIDPSTGATPHSHAPGAPAHSHAPALDPQQCYHNTAYAWQNGICPPITWTYLGNPRPVVYFKDWTGAAWPVSAASSTWNAQWGIDVYRVPGSTTCPSSIHCVPVYEANSTEDYCGRAHLLWNATTRTFIDGNVWVFLNNYWSDRGKCPAGRRATTCHELGHAIGLDHNTSTTSCLSTTGGSSRSQVPNSDDYWVLENISY